MYCFSWAQNLDAVRKWIDRIDIAVYLRSCARRLGMYEHTLFRERIVRAEFESAAKLWRITTDKRVLRSRLFVLATGLLSEPQTPKVLDAYKGVKFHSAAWPVDEFAGDAAALDVVRDKRVMVVGGAASAVQIVPEIVKVAKSVVVVQRSRAFTNCHCVIDATVSRKARHLLCCLQACLVAIHA